MKFFRYELSNKREPIANFQLKKILFHGIINFAVLYWKLTFKRKFEKLPIK